MKIYGKKREIAENYYEVEYKEYRQDGSLKAIGTEDFSTKRYNNLEGRAVYTWDGEKRNKGGYRWFDYQGYFRTDNLKELKNYMELKYNNAAMVQIRKY
jgi:hypothetical protein